MQILFFFSLQLSVSVQIPKALGGLNSEALYIDTNTNFTLDRFKGILVGLKYWI